MSIAQQIENYFRTTDLGLGAFLLSQPSIEFKGIHPQSNRSLYFLFYPKDSCDRLSAEFMSGKAKVLAFRYWESMKMAKRMLFEFKNSHEKL